MNEGDEIPRPTRGSEGRSGLSLADQVALLRNSQSPTGMVEFTRALVAGKLDLLFPFHLDNTNRYLASIRGAENANVNSVPSLVVLLYPILSDKVLEVITPTAEVLEGEFSLMAAYHPNTFKSDGNKGSRLDARFKLIDEPARQIVISKGGILYIQTTDQQPYDAVIEFNGKGQIIDILRPGLYHLERQWGQLLRQTARQIEEETASLNTVFAYDQALATLGEDGQQLLQPRAYFSDRTLRDQVIDHLGLTKSQLATARVNPGATVEAMLNKPFETKSMIGGTGNTSIPPIVFQ